MKTIAKKSRRSRRKVARITSIKIKSNIRAGGLNAVNHHRKPRTIKIKSNIRAGGLNAVNHCRRLAR